jgi:hypothetical protein
MPLRPERRWPRIVAGYGSLFLVTAAAASFLCDSAAVANRPIVIQFAVGFIVAVLLIRLRNYFRGDPLGEQRSAFEDALRSQPVAPKLDAQFSRLREEVTNGVARHGYFEKVLWPRLCALSHRRGGPDVPLPIRRGLGRGPSRRTLAVLVESIEGRRTDL